MGRLSDRRLPILKRPGLIVTALNLTLAVSFATDTETRTFKVLVAPGEGVSGSALSRVADLTATLDKQPYRIRSAEPFRAGEGRTAIVLDFAGTTLMNHACLMAEALSAMARIHESPPPLLVAAGPSRFVNPGPSQDLNVYSGEDLRALTSECESGKEPKAWRSMVDQFLAGGYSLSTFFDLRNNYASQDAPVRVFWLAEKFRAFDSWGGSIDADFPPFVGIEGVAEADLTFFPVVFGEWNKGRLKNPSGDHVKEAELLAGWTGGFVSTVSGKPGDTLVRALEKSSQGVVLTLEGPVTTDGVQPAKAKTLSIRSNGASPPVTWQRRFVVNREGSVKPLPHGHLAQFVLPSGQLGLSYGCQAPDVSAGDRTLAVTLPPEVVAAPSGQVDVYLDYPNEKGLAKQRATLARTQGSTGSLCLPLIHARDGMKFRIVVVDRASGWVGAADGVLAATKDDQ